MMIDVLPDLNVHERLPPHLPTSPHSLQAGAGDMSDSPEPRSSLIHQPRLILLSR